MRPPSNSLTTVQEREQAGYQQDTRTSTPALDSIVVIYWDQVQHVMLGLPELSLVWIKALFIV